MPLYLMIEWHFLLQMKHSESTCLANKYALTALNGRIWNTANMFQCFLAGIIAGSIIVTLLLITF
jgi:hypothetical protein